MAKYRGKNLKYFIYNHDLYFNKLNIFLKRYYYFYFIKFTKHFLKIYKNTL